MTQKNIILVTGAAGFIAQRLIAGLKNRFDCEIRGIDIVPGPYPGCDVSEQCDLSLELKKNPVLVQLMNGVDTLYNLAGKVHSLLEVKGDVEEYWRVNVTGSENVLNAAKQGSVRKFVFFSTVKVFGEYQTVQGDRPLCEQDEPSPDTPYGETKLVFEKELMRDCGSITPVILRLSMVYGSGAKGNMAKLIHAVEKGIPIPLPEFGNKRSMIDVRDVVNGAILAGTSDKARGIYQLTDGHAYSTRQILEYVRESLGKKPGYIALPKFCFRLPALIGDGIGKLRGRRFFFDSDALNKIAGNAWFSSEKVRSELGFETVWDLKSSLLEGRRQNQTSAKG
ncbi:MAG: NAD-dependent epimerase/dehydratase family protein [Lentisphaeria bacterium]|nr:NAD-dependent epimerase/dehydratase family protein [Lentisphaeria bacterium]